MKAAEARKLIGKAVSYRRRCSLLWPSTGIIHEVRGRNVRIGYPGTPGDWYWLPDMVISELPIIDDATLEP